MPGRHPWLTSLVTSTSILGLTATGGLVLLANHFVTELSQPHGPLDDVQFTIELPLSAKEPPSAYQRALTFRTSDGVLLRGDFWAQPHAAPTVVLCHGYRVTREYVRPAATIQYQLGYNVLFFDFRGHGASDSVITSGGRAEVRDLEAAVFAASTQPETTPHCIIIHGFSMGAAAALLMPAHPNVAAIIADSPYARLDEILRRVVIYQLSQQSARWKPQLTTLRRLSPSIAWATVATSKAVFRLRYGYSFTARPVKRFRRHMWRARTRPSKDTPILLIHATGDDLIPLAHARQIVARAQATGAPIETYFVDYPAHCGASAYDLEQYKAVIQDFLARYLGEHFPKP